MKKPNIEMQEVLTNFDKLNNKPLEKLAPEVARQQAELKDAVMATINDHITKRLMGVVEPVAKVEHITIDGPGGDLLMRIYRYQEINEKLQPATLYFHGGGMVIANLNSYDSSCRALCNAAQCVVISVAYRQAPEHKFPAAHEDAFYSYEWLMRNASSIGVDVTKIAVTGESAGGNLAAGICLESKQRGLAQPVHQVLVYPMIEAKFNTDSYDENEFAKPLNKEMMKWFWSHYLADNHQKDQFLAAPIHYKDLTDIASATIILAEIDPLRSEGEAYAARLFQAGVKVKLKIFDGVTHEFFGMGAVVPEGKEAVMLAADQLKLAFFGDDDPGEIYINQYPEMMIG